MKFATQLLIAFLIAATATGQHADSLKVIDVPFEDILDDGFHSAGRDNKQVFKWFTFFDDFSSDINGWSGIDSNASKVTRIADGQLSMNVNKGFFLSQKRYKIDTNADFEVAVWARCLSENTTTGFGIEFNSNTCTNAYYTFMIAANGFFCVKRVYKLRSGGRWENLCYWRSSAYINTGTNGNDLKVQRTSKQLHFLINGHEVFQYPYDGAFGNYFGVCTEGPQHVAFDNFIITGRKVDGDGY